MHILNIMQCTNLGGMEQASLRLMKGLQQLGHSCRVLSLNPLGEIEPLLAEADIAAEGMTYSGIGGWQSYKMLSHRLAGIQANGLLMTGHNLMAIAALGNIAKGHRLLAMHYHHKGVKPNWQWRLIYEAARRKFNIITFPSDFVRNEAIKICPAITKISYTVRNPLPIPETITHEQRQQARTALGIPANVKVVGNAGWLIERKRFDIFLRVAKEIIIAERDVFFAIAGDGVERKPLEQLANDLGISQHILWLGWQKDLSSFYKSIDVLLFNSDWDAFPTTPQEAMSWGVPVVASNLHGGLDEVISSSKYGFLFKSHDIKGLADAVKFLIQSEDTELGLNSRALIQEMCDATTISKQVESFLLGDR